VDSQPTGIGPIEHRLDEAALKAPSESGLPLLHAPTPEQWQAGRDGKRQLNVERSVVVRLEQASDRRAQHYLRDPRAEMLDLFDDRRPAGDRPMNPENLLRHDVDRSNIAFSLRHAPPLAAVPADPRRPASRERLVRR